MKGVVGDSLPPNELPQCIICFALKPGAERGMNASEKRCAVFRKHFQNALSFLGKSRLLGLQFRWQQKVWKRLSKIESDSPVAIADLLQSNPNNFAGSHHRIEIASLIIGDTRRKDFAFQFGNQQRGALQVLHGVK